MKQTERCLPSTRRVCKRRSSSHAMWWLTLLPLVSGHNWLQWPKSRGGGGGAATTASRRVAVLPPRTGSEQCEKGWEVRDERGATVCKSCQRFGYTLGAGDVAMFTVNEAVQCSQHEAAIAH